MSFTETQTALEKRPSASGSVSAPPKTSFQAHETINLGRIASTGSRQQQQPEQDIRDELPPPSTAVEALERWNSPRRNMYALFSTYLSFMILGLNDASPGTHPLCWYRQNHLLRTKLIEQLEEYYDLTYTVVSLIFLSPVVGYSLAAALNNQVHRRYGQRGIAFIAGVCHLITYLTFSLHPPWPVMVVFFIFAGFGNGLADAAWCAWTGNMVSANKVQGFLQSFYSLGATISPLIATSMITQADLPWYTWYYVMTATAALEVVLCTWAFWHKTGERYRAENHKSEGSGSTTWAAVNNRVTIICALFFMTYVGAEVALGGWIVTFMLRVRDAKRYAAGISATGFWAGMTVGRALLGFITERYGERVCVCVYLALSLGLELIFWLVPRFVVSAVAVAFLGFFLGPIFPAGVVMCAKLLPKHLHVSALGAATAIAGVGGAGVPFAVGAIAQARGVWVLQPIILSLLAVITLLWLLIPRVKKRDL